VGGWEDGAIPRCREYRKRSKFRMGDELSVYIVTLKCFGDFSGENDVQLDSGN